MQISMQNSLIYTYYMLQQEEWEVERILQRGRFNNITHYLVKWKGYTLQQSTWEPITNLEHCPDAILAFETELKQVAAPAKPAEKQSALRLQKVFPDQSSPIQALRSDNDERDIEGLQKIESTETKQSQKKQGQGENSSNKGPKTNLIVEKECEAAEMSHNEIKKEEGKPTRKRDKAKMQIDSDGSSKKKRLKGQPSKKQKACSPLNQVPPNQGERVQKGVKWAQDISNMKVTPVKDRQASDKKEIDIEPICLPKEPSINPQKHKIEAVSIPPNMCQVECLKKEANAISPQQLRKEIDQASNQNIFAPYNHTRLERYNFCDFQLTKSKRILLQNITRKKQGESRIKEPLKILDLSGERELLSELSRFEKEGEPLELLVVMALLRVPYGWMILGRRTQHDKQVLVDVGLLRNATWMALVRMLT